MLKPTSISPGLPGENNPNPKIVQPTTIQPSAGSDNVDKPKIVPTTIVVGATPEPRQFMPKVSQPTSIAGGVKRERIDISVAMLRVSNAGVSDAILNKAVSIIQMLNLEALDDRQVIMWGHDLQKRHGDLVSECLKVVQSEPLKKTHRHLLRIIEIISLIDLKKLCESGIGNSVVKVFRKATKAIDTPEELSEAQEELEQLVKLISLEIEPLLKIKDQLETVSGQINDLGDEIETLAIAADWLSTYLKDKNNILYQRFFERSLSLTQSLTQIKSSSSMRQVQIEQPLELISAVQSIALVQIPGWLGSIVNLKIMLDQGKTPNVTYVSELNDQTQKVLQGLKGK